MKVLNTVEFMIFFLAEFEADLQAAWSVRKNIHHQGVTSTQTPHSSSAPSMHSQVKAGQYSRHGAIPAQQTSGPKAVFGNKEKGTSIYYDFFCYFMTYNGGTI